MAGESTRSMPSTGVLQSNGGLQSSVEEYLLADLMKASTVSINVKKKV